MSLKGISFEKPSARRIFVNPVGLRGISFEKPENLKFIKVIGKKGVPLANAKVIVQDTGEDSVSYTDSTGLAEIVPDVGQTVNILVSQYKTFRKAVSYTTDSEPLVKTVLLDTNLPIIVPPRITETPV